MVARATVMSKSGMVSSAHELASFWGAKILSQGGTVVDAAITTSAVLCVTQNHMCGLGGDFFSLVKIGGKIFNLNGSGRASENATIRFYHEEKKFDNIPRRGPLAALTVPGIVHAWGDLHSRFGTIELKKLLEPAISYAGNGFPVTTNYVNAIRDSVSSLGAFSGWSEIFLPNNSIPLQGTLFKQSDLASSLKEIADDGVSSFYSGSLSEQIVKGISEEGGLLTFDDFARHTSTWDEPLKTSYRGTTVYETAPNSQAATVILWLNMLEECDLSKFAVDSPRLFEIFFDTCIRAYGERAKHITDPSFHELPKDFTSKEYAAKLLSRQSSESSLPPSSENSGDISYFAIGESNGDCISVIQSNYGGFGSGLVPKGTGIVLHNRGCYFTLDEKHLNALAAGKRTFHTLCASLGEYQSGESRFCLGSMGTDIQPQIQVQLLTKILDYDMDVQTAIDYPRWGIPFSIYESPSRIFLEPGLETFVPTARKIAAKARLSVELMQSFTSSAGHAQAVCFGGDGTLLGGADSRGDGFAVGY